MFLSRSDIVLIVITFVGAVGLRVSRTRSSGSDGSEMISVAAVGPTSNVVTGCPPAIKVIVWGASLIPVISRMRG